MRKAILLCLGFACIGLHGLSQSSIRNARTKSWQCLVYRITGDTAEKYITKRVFSPDHYLNQTPFTVWPADSLQYEELPVGNYLILSVNETELLAEYYCQSNLRAFPLNNQHRVQLEVKNDTGKRISNARLWVNKKEMKYNKAISGFQLKQKKTDEALIKIAIPGDTSFMELTAMEQMQKNGWRQWWTNLSYTKAGRVITWPVRKVSRMFKLPASDWFRKRYRSFNSKRGYMIFNKPKYLPGDTVKFKAYILGKRAKQYRKGLRMFLDYTFNGRAVTKDMGVILPVTPGAFLYEFVLGDSLETDRNYTITFKNKKDHSLMRGSFKMEDYLLDEVAVYNLRSEKENYFRHDTLVFYANAKDANGLALMDGRVNLYLLTKNINTFYKEREFIPDTLWKGEKILSVEGDTKFGIPAKDFPDADLLLRAVAEFRNSNNEIEEKDMEIQFTAQSRTIEVRQEAGYIMAEYIENGIPLVKEGRLSYNEEDKERAISFPWKQKIDPFIGKYYFQTEDEKGNITSSEDFEPEKNYSLSFSRIQQKDTAGFYLYNPQRIPVHYTVFNGNKIIETLSDTAEWISWKKILPKKKIYNVEWNYIWAGEEVKGGNTIAVLDKILETKINSAQTIYPGQTDTITVSVKDYKGRPAPDVNLTAISYNSQFKQDIHVSEPPYIQKFRTKRRILFDNYELDEVGFTKRLLLGQHQRWRNNFGLDTMTYYQLLFPKEDYTITSSLVSDFTPQLAVHLVEKGEPREIYMLYINREFAWYNGVTDKSKYAFTVVPGYTQIAFRLKNKYVEIDSIYLQPFYKHDISFDLDHLPAKAKVIERDEYYTPEERSQLEKHIWQLQNDPRTDNGYVWQHDRLIFIGASNHNYSSHLIGPFNNYDSLQFFKPGDFDFKFPFEPSYQYRLTPHTARLERKYIFPYQAKALLPDISKTRWILGDTVVAPPVINYHKKSVTPSFLYSNDNTYSISFKRGVGSLKLQLPPDSSFAFAILYGRLQDTTIIRIRSYQLNNFFDILPGQYELVLVTHGQRYLSAQGLQIDANGTYCLKWSKPVYETSNPAIEEIRRQYEKPVDKEAIKKYFNETSEYFKAPIQQTGLPLPKGNCTITGFVSDKKGKSPIPGTTVHIKGYSSGTATLADGSFILKNLLYGNYVIVFSMVGYSPLEKRVNLPEGEIATVDAQLTMMEANLSEVIVTGYGTSKRKSLTGSISTIPGEELTSSLMGRVAGVSIQDYSRRDSVSVYIRGASSITANTKPLYVINGVLMDELPEGFVMEGAQMNILKDATAISLYGERAANGVIIITTPDFLPKDIRDKFRDYAFWKPNFFTDKNGEAKFTVTYPDNITGWQTFVLGMDKKRRLTRATSFVKSFKPLLAQLSTPQFLIEGDSSFFIGKVINYTPADIALTAKFKVNDVLSGSSNKSAGAKGSITDKMLVVAEGTDTLTSQYSVSTASGYSDGELRKIPVFKRGVEETIGQFWVLDNDTSFSFVPDKNAEEIRFYAQNSTLDVLLEEIKYLKEYPYYCMEQTASKLTGLLMEKEIRQTLKQPFKGEKEIQQLTSKLQKAQLFNGGWGWWEGGEANLSITNYVTMALLPLRNDELVQANIRNGLLYLQNRLPTLKEQELLQALFTLSAAGHSMDFGYYLSKLKFDSLTVHQQWQLIDIRQQQKLNYKSELEKLLAKKTETMFGGVHWGLDSYSWDNNMIATTTLAFKIIRREKEYQPYLKKIIQFFLERRQGGRWRNTVESASILSAISPTILNNNNEFQSAASLQISGQNDIHINTFPYAGKAEGANQPLTVRRSGGGLLYFSIWQRVFNPKPEPVNDKFMINTRFEKNGAVVPSFVAGEKVIMKADVYVLKDAEYVLVEIPIPAGCTYSSKKSENLGTHIEYRKDKVILFIAKMTKGEYSYEIELEPRYSGSYSLNPVKAELMYFPVFYGRNNMKNLTIKSSPEKLVN
ncbi:MAG: carboxypeptidase-like regulatory domain-containing protein [Chitinophagaceae bacterium]